MKKDYTLSRQGDHLIGRFNAMASPCELLIDIQDKALGERLLNEAYLETKRIESKYSRYISGNLMHCINNSQGNAVAIDTETFQLLRFADNCFTLSDGMFDITSGILRKAWQFNGSDKLPTLRQVKALLPHLGWEHINFDAHNITVPVNHELDFGGFGKEYAVNKVAQIMSRELPKHSVLVNFGGDIQVTRPRNESPYWQVGIENPTSNKTTGIVNIAQGGLATSGDANRFLLKNGIRYSHILDPKTGYPVADAPRSVTVASDHCIQAGLMATLSLLQGKNAESFLESQSLVYWCQR